MSTSRSICLIDPSLILRQSLGGLLRQQGYKVSDCSDGQMAIEIIDLSTPDVLILNPNLPRNNGIELLYEIQSYNDTQNIPVVLLADNPNVFQSHQAVLAQLNVDVVLARTKLSIGSLVSAIEHSTSKTLKAD